MHQLIVVRAPDGVIVMSRLYFRASARWNVAGSEMLPYRSVAVLSVAFVDGGGTINPQRRSVG